MTNEQENELKFLAARNRLGVKLQLMRDFVVETGVKKMGKAKYDNLFEVSSLGLMLIMENRFQSDEISKLRTQLNREMAMNTELMAKYRDQTNS